MATTGRDNGMRDAAGADRGQPDKDKDKDKGSNSKDRDDGTRAPVGTGGGAHAPRGNQAGKDAQGNEIGDKGNPNAAVHTDPETGISVQRTRQAQENLEKAYKDFADQGLGDVIGDLLGFSDIDPSTDPEFNAAEMDAPNTSVMLLASLWELAAQCLAFRLPGKSRTH